jgi:hypothetical protein
MKIEKFWIIGIKGFYIKNNRKQRNEGSFKEDS